MASTTDSPSRTVDDVLGDPPHIAMLMTMIGPAHSSRPLMCLRASGGRLAFLVDRSSDWVAAIERGEAVVHVTVADESKNTYLAVNGTATVSTDRAAVHELWTPMALAFFGSPDDPAVAVLTFDVSDGEYWDGPSGRVGRTLALVRAALTDDPSRVGRHGTVSPRGA